MSQQSRGALQNRVLEMLRNVYGPSVPRPKQALVTRWFSDPFTRGSYSFIPVGANYDDLDALAAPVGGRLLFAGEATHRVRSASADGAFSSGLREAKRLLGQPTVRICPLSGGTTASIDAPDRLLARVARWRQAIA